MNKYKGLGERWSRWQKKKKKKDERGKGRKQNLIIVTLFRCHYVKNIYFKYVHFMAFKNASNVGTIWNLMEIWRKIQFVRFKKVRGKMCQNNLFEKKFPKSKKITSKRCNLSFFMLVRIYINNYKWDSSHIVNWHFLVLISFSFQF